MLEHVGSSKYLLISTLAMPQTYVRDLYEFDTRTHRHFTAVDLMWYSLRALNRQNRPYPDDYFVLATTLVGHEKEGL